MTSADDLPEFHTVLRGYDRAEVDAHIAELTERLEAAEDRGRRAEAASEGLDALAAAGPRVTRIFELAREDTFADDVRPLPPPPLALDDDEFEDDGAVAPPPPADPDW